jgi:tetratricopeptide (TPR) repeat protein
MILRTPIAGIPFDPRFRGRWGISAELLLQRGSSDIAQSPNHGEPPANGHAGYYSEGAFELAREYYERLIIQYPHRKGQTHVTDALTFYPAMFSLWLYEICEQGKLARKQLEQRRSATPDSVFGDDFDRTRFEASRIDAEELLRARELAERLDQLVASPPLDSQGPLLRLRGMVALWVADLILKGDVPTNEGRYEDEEDSEIDVKSTEERLNIFLESRREFERALEFFDKAHNHGETLIETVGSVDLKVRDLSRRIAKLGG